MKALETLFGSELRPRVLKLLFQNQDFLFGPKDLKEKLKIKGLSLAKIVKEIKVLLKVQMLTVKKSGGKRHFSLNKNFEFYNEFSNIFTKAEPQLKDKINQLSKKLPGLKILLLSGLFLAKPGSRVDLFLVADKIKESAVKNLVVSLEKEIGKEINYAFMQTNEFRYRQEMMDRFLKEIFSGPKEIVINKLKDLSLGN